MTARTSPDAAPDDAGATTLHALAAAKVNLTLAVGDVRADGFHDLESVVVRLSLADRLSVAVDGERRTGPDTLTVVPGGTLADLPADENLVMRAARLLRERADVPLPRLRFRLEKRIPVRAGLGGGSSDAASALDLAARAWGIDLPLDDRLRLAADLGSDVPFFALGAAAALVQGRGERVRELPAPASGAVLLVAPQVTLSTPEVFAAFDADAAARRSSDGGRLTVRVAAALGHGLEGGALAAMSDALRDANDLWAAAATLLPTLPGLRGALEERLGRPVLLSGSGPSLFALYASVDEARAAGQTLIAEAPPALGGARTIVAAFDRP